MRARFGTAIANGDRLRIEAVGEGRACPGGRLLTATGDQDDTTARRAVPWALR